MHEYKPLSVVWKNFLQNSSKLVNNTRWSCHSHPSWRQTRFFLQPVPSRVFLQSIPPRVFLQPIPSRFFLQSIPPWVFLQPIPSRFFLQPVPWLRCPPHSSPANSSRFQKLVRDCFQLRPEVGIYKGKSKSENYWKSSPSSKLFLSRSWREWRNRGL